jgi:hypothetical protein
MLQGLIDSQYLSVVGAVFLLEQVQLLREECEGLPGTVDTLLQHGIHGGSEGICDECKWRGCVGVGHESGAWQTRLALFKGPVEIRRPGDWMTALDSRAGESIT